MKTTKKTEQEQPHARGKAHNLKQISGRSAFIALLLIVLLLAACGASGAPNTAGHGVASVPRHPACIMTVTFPDDPVWTTTSFQAFTSLEDAKDHCILVLAAEDTPFRVTVECIACGALYSVDASTEEGYEDILVCSCKPQEDQANNASTAYLKITATSETMDAPLPYFCGYLSVYNDTCEEIRAQQEAAAAAEAETTIPTEQEDEAPTDVPPETFK